MEQLLINCDLGENESTEQTAALLQMIEAANIACGVHAGSQKKTQLTVQMAKEAGVRIGAHPGLETDGGRGVGVPDVAKFAKLLADQLSFFASTVEEAEASWHHVKLHGSLYSAVERSALMAEVYLEALAGLDAEVAIFCLAGGPLATRARAAGFSVFEEIFADRGYRSDCALVPRGEPGDLMTNPVEVATRIEAYVKTGILPAVNGASLTLKGDTVCVHSDSTNSLELLRLLKKSLSGL